MDTPEYNFTTMKNFTLFLIILFPQILNAQLSIAGNDSMVVSSGTIFSVQDHVINNGKITGSGKLILNGSATQNFSGNGSFSNVELNNSNGAAITNASSNQVKITGTYIPTAGILTSNERLALKSDQNGTAIITQGNTAGNYINGKVILERYIPAKRAWRLIGFPITTAASPTINEALQDSVGGNSSSNPNPGFGTHITGGSIANGFDQNGTGFSSLKTLAGTSWQAVTTTNQALSNDQKYFIFIRGSRANNLSLGTAASADKTTLRFKANVNQGDQNININSTGWQLIPNPFNARLNLNQVAIVNSGLINRNFKFWDPKMGGSNNVGGYVTASFNGIDYDFTPVPVSAITEYAQPFAAFFVDAIATGALSIKEAHKCNCGSDNVFRPAADLQTKIRINLKSFNNDGTNAIVDGVLAVFNEKYSSDIDAFDAVNLKNTNTESLGILRSDQKISIERRSDQFEIDTINLHLSNVFIRNYQFEISASNFNRLGLTAVLQDLFTGIQTELNPNGISLYNFSVNSNTGTYASNRFRIILKKETLILPQATIKIFNATPIKNNYAGTGAVSLNWKLINQQYISSNQIEKSTDSTHFTTLGSVSISDLLLSEGNYQLTDTEPFIGNNYYRVKITERNATAYYSPILKVMVKNHELVQLVQNPITNNKILIQIETEVGQQHHFILTDNRGISIMQSSFYQEAGTHIKELPVSVKLEKGWYFGKLQTANDKSTTLKIYVGN